MTDEQKEAWGNFAEALKNFDEKQKEQLVDDFLAKLKYVIMNLEDTDGLFTPLTREQQEGGRGSR